MPKGSSGSASVSFPKLSRDEVVEHIRARMEELRLQIPVIRAVLFGSYASGRHTASSDIDLLLVYAGDPRPDAFAIVKRTIGLPGLEPHVYAESEADRVGDVIGRMTRNGVVILD